MKGKNQVDINTGTPLSKNKSFNRKGTLKATFKDDSSWTKLSTKKNFNKERFLMWIAVGLIIVVMVYCVFFIGLKQTNFFGAETKNVQAIW